MSDNEKNVNRNDDGIGELMDAFGGYDDSAAPEEIFVDMPEEEIAPEKKPTIELPEISLDDESIPEAEEFVADEGTVLEIPEEKSDPPNEKPEGAKHRKDKKEKKEKKEKPVKEKTEKPEKPKKSDGDEGEQKPVSPIRLVLVLTVICAAVALLLASVNNFTEAKIAANNEKAMLDSIRDIFDGTVQAESVAVPEESELTSAYLVIKDGGVCGYAASVAPAGFGGPLNLMVGVDSAGAVVGVEIVSMSETPGLGSKVGGVDFLSRFTGMSGNVAVDVISGATVSSKAVTAGVNSALASPLDLAALASERGMSVIAFDASAPSTETEPPVTEAPVSEVATDAPATEAPVTVAPVTEAAPPDVSKGDTPPQNIVENPNKADEAIHAEYEEDTAEYETLTTEPETSESEETEAE